MNDKCTACGGLLKPQDYFHKSKVGSFEVSISEGKVPTCQQCGEARIDILRLAGFERRAAWLLLKMPHDVGGEAIKFARHTLGLRQKDLAKRLEVSEQQVSRWEKRKKVDRFSRLAVSALFCWNPTLFLDFNGEKTEEGHILLFPERDSTREWTIGDRVWATDGQATVWAHITTYKSKFVTATLDSTTVIRKQQ